MGRNISRSLTSRACINVECMCTREATGICVRRVQSAGGISRLRVGAGCTSYAWFFARVLVADDIPDAAEVLGMLLEEAGFEVRIAYGCAHLRALRPWQHH
jgi:hypothetical protein